MRASQTKCDRTKDVNIVSFNARSVVRKWHLICAELLTYNPDVIAITESWLADYMIKFYNYNNYQSFSKFCAGGNGGGVLLLLSGSFSVVEVHPSDIPPNSCEFLLVLDKEFGNSWILIYRPPDVSVEDTQLLFRSIDAILSLHPNAIVLEDFNLGDICWHSSRTNNSISVEFLELCAMWDLKQPARGSKCLDLLLVSQPENISEVTVFPPIATSDHNMVYCRLARANQQWPSIETRYDFTIANYATLSQILRCQNWHMLFAESVSINDYWLVLYSLLQVLIRDYVPVSSFHRHFSRRKLPIPRHIRTTILHKRKAWKRWKQDQTVNNKLLYDATSAECSKSVEDHRTREESYLLDISQRHFYHYVSKHLHPNAHDNVTLCDAGSTHTDLADSARSFLNEFSKNFTEPTKCVSDSLTRNLIELECNLSNTLSHININETSVCCALHGRGHTAAGHDGISGILYNKLADMLVLPLTILFQQSIHQKRIPDMWRLAHIVPLYKCKGNKSCVSSYRPISFTDIASKLLEGIVASQIKSFWRFNNLICAEQHGFLWHQSTVSNLAACDMKIAEMLNEQNACDFFYSILHEHSIKCHIRSFYRRCVC